MFTKSSLECTSQPISKLLKWKEGVKLVPADRGICYSPSWLDVDDREVMAIGGGEGGWGG